MEPGTAGLNRAVASIALGPAPSQVTFVVTGNPTSLNPIKAFKQGAADEPADRRFLLAGARCSGCGFVEFYAAEPIA
jgi:hypothetical protein